MSGISLDELVDIQITDGTNTLAINGNGSIDVNFAAGAAVEITDGVDTLAINGDGSINAVVSATDLDIRDLSASQDNVAISDGTDTLAVNADGSINVNLTDDGIADDAADSGNPLKVGGRGVDGLLTALSASNDRFDLLGDLYRRVWVNTSANVGMTVGTETVGTTAAEVAASPLAGRRFVTIQNEGTVDVYMGHSAAVTTANGIKISKKSSATFELGEDIDIFMISGSAGQDVRILQAG
jgi:hypothetical protein